MALVKRLVQRLAPDAAIGIGLFLIPLAFFWQVTIGNRTLLPADNIYQYEPWASYRQDLGVPAVPHNSLLSDLVLENLPWKQFIRQSIANHEIPLWNPYLFAGTPFLAEGQHSALYPFSVIYYVLPLDKAYGWFTVSQLGLAGLLMYLFMRGLGIGRFGAVLSAIAYQMSSFFIASVVFQMIIAAAAWLPFLLLMVEFTIRQRPLFGRPAVIPWVALGAIGLGMEILAGHIEVTYYALLVMGFWAACRLGWMIVQKQRDHLVRTAGSLIALVVLGVGVGAVQFVPLFDLLRYNFREGSASFEQVRGYAFPARHVLEFVMPNIYGSPAQHDYFDVFAGQTKPFTWTRSDASTVTDTYWEVNKNYVEGACYVGLLTLFLAAIAVLNLLFERADQARIASAGPYREIFALLALISLSFVFGTIAYAILYYGLPGINQLHSPFRWVFPLTLCLAALGGFGAEALRRAAESRAAGALPSFTAKLTVRLGYAAIGAGALVLIGLLASRIFFERLRGPIESLFHKLALADQTFPDVATFYSVEFRSILIFGALLLACGAILRLSQTSIQWRKVPIWMALAVVVLTADLALASAGFNPAADPAWLSFMPPAIQWLQAHDPQNWRFATVEGRTKTLNANLGWLYGLQDIEGYDSIIPKQYVDYMSGIQDQNQLLYNRIAAFTPQSILRTASKAQMKQLGVRYIVSDVVLDTAPDSGLQLAYQDRGTWIYENVDAAPRALLGVTGNSSQTPPTWDQLEASGSGATVVQSGATQIVVDVSPHSTESGESTYWLVLTNSNLPGWRAYEKPQDAPDDQEKEVPVLTALGNFAGVPIPPDSTTVRFKYTPPSVQVGAFATFLALVAILFAFLLWIWRLVNVGRMTESSDVRRLAKNTFAPIFLNLFNRGIDFGFALITFRLLAPSQAGIYYYAIVVYGWFDILTNFGLNTWLIREVSRDRASARRYLFHTTALRLALAVACVPLVIGFLALNEARFPPADAVEAAQHTTTILAILLLYIGLVPGSISTGLSALFYPFEKAEIPAAISTVTSILRATVGVAVLLAGWSVLGLAGASILLNVITLAILAAQAWPLIAHASHP
ncbi:MAG TPA: oligosaccharide flippase family protein, partial [Aggregatilineales bacterium]|nr:oligosaccharide flippase family protein [Aggregatilineales bacterium]